jgi:hypothetical protein
LVHIYILHNFYFPIDLDLTYHQVTRAAAVGCQSGGSHKFVVELLHLKPKGEGNSSSASFPIPLDLHYRLPTQPDPDRRTPADQPVHHRSCRSCRLPHSVLPCRPNPPGLSPTSSSAAMSLLCRCRAHGHSPCAFGRQPFAFAPAVTPLLEFWPFMAQPINSKSNNS